MASTPKITTKLSRFQDALTPCVESALQHPCVKPIFLVWTTNYLAGLLPICHQSRRGQADRHYQSRLIANRMAQSNHWAICFSVAREIGGPGNARPSFCPSSFFGLTNKLLSTHP